MAGAVAVVLCCAVLSQWCLMFHVVYVAERRRLIGLILLRTRGGRMSLIRGHCIFSTR